jgi:hypothetical protein
MTSDTSSNTSTILIYIQKKTEIADFQRSNTMHRGIPHYNNTKKEKSFLRSDCRSLRQEIPRHLWYPNVHYHVHKSPPLDPVLSQMNPTHILRYYFLDQV